MSRRLVRYIVGAGLVLGTVFLAVASSHREAPLISADPLADNTDVYAFVSPDAPDTVTLIANWIPLEAPAGGPNFYKFGDDVLYQLNIDNDGDAKDDIVYEFRFKTHIQNRKTFLYNTGPISSLDDPNFNIRQTYSVTRIDRHGRAVLGTGLATPPVNVGVRSTPTYETLADAAIHTLSDGSKVFAGQRDDPFFVDLGSVFDLLGLRPFNPAHLVPLPPAPGVDGHGEGGLVGALLRRHHQRDVERVQALPLTRHADDPSTVGRHEVDGLGRRLLRGHDEVALVFAVGVVHHDHHPATPDVIHRFLDRGEAHLLGAVLVPFGVHRSTPVSRSTYFAITSASRLTRSPGRSVPRVVASIV